MEVKSGEVLEFPVGSDGVLWFGSRLCVPDVGGLRKNKLIFCLHSSCWSNQTVSRLEPIILVEWDEEIYD